VKSFIALIRREYLEHRVAFFYAPLVLVALFALFVAFGVGFRHFELALTATMFGSRARVFESSYFGVLGLWWLYLSMLLFFYFADAYHADTRNNAMLFWKSMPQSDFKLLLSKFAAGLTIFPVLVFGAALLCGLIVVLALTVLPLISQGYVAPPPLEMLTGWLQLSVAAIVYLVAALLWFAPFFAWVGALSTLVGRWSVPLALLIPVGLSLFEGIFDFSTAPGGSYLLTFLRERANLRYDTGPLFDAALSTAPIDLKATLGALVAGIDWPQTVMGMVFALVVIYLASLYRRRVIKG
jgi:ABC-2 type transport system permease protein